MSPYTQTAGWDVLRVTKAEAAGNDFVIVFDPDDLLDLSPEIVVRLCDRRKGIGGDGVIRLVRHHQQAASAGDSAAPAGSLQPRSSPVFFMDYRNSDGSVAEMCGNGVRCAALYLLRRGIVEGPDIEIDTRAGRKLVSVGSEPGRLVVDMGPVSLAAGEFVDLSSGSIELIEQPTPTRPALIRVHISPEPGVVGEERSGRDVPGSGPKPARVDAFIVGVGNPHAVVFYDSRASDDIASATRRLGPILERHPCFPNGINVEFATPLGRGLFEVRVWERGAGETLSCGTGACAVGVAAIATGRANSNSVVLRFPGGELRVTWNGSVFLEGPTREVFDAQVSLDRLFEG